MKIVVTGGSGFLGQRLIRALAERGALHFDGRARAITGITALDTQRSVGEFTDARVRYVQGDLADRAVVADAMAGAAHAR